MNNLPSTGLNLSDVATRSWHRVAATVGGVLGARGIFIARRFFIAFAISFVLGTLYIFSISPKYEAVAVLAPQEATEGGNSMLSELASSMGSLSSLQSFNLTPQATNFIAFQKIIVTTQFADDLMRHSDIVKVLFPGGKRISRLSRLVRGAMGQPVSSQVTPWDVRAYLESNILVQTQLDSNYLILSYPNTDRKKALHILSLVIQRADYLIKQEDRNSLTDQINYLSNVMRNNTDVVRQDLFRQMLAEKLAKKVLLDTQKNYAVKVFDAPSAPPLPNSPNITVLVVLLTVFSVLVGAIVAATSLWWMQRRRQ